MTAAFEQIRPYVASPLVWSMLLGFLGVWLLLPRGNTRFRPVGGLLAAASLGLLASVLPRFGDLFMVGVFWTLAALTCGSAVATISMRSPVYCAIWFAVALLSTAGLFLLQGAQFLGVATIVVYAGAILVTFLFVIMLAQPEGHDYYDRISWGTVPTTFATLAGVLLVGGLAYRLVSLDEASSSRLPGGNGLASNSQSGSPTFVPSTEPVGTGPARQAGPTEKLLHREHMAKLGNELFSKHLVSVEVAGTLLLVALVGAIAIMIQGRDARPPAPQRPAGGPGHA